MHIYESLICFAACLLLVVLNKSIDGFLLDLLIEGDLHELVHDDPFKLAAEAAEKRLNRFCC